MKLIYLSPVPWASAAQRPHRYVEYFHGCTGKDVLWINPYPVRFPRPDDFIRLWHSSSLSDSFIPEWLTVLRIRSLPIEPLQSLGKLNLLLWERAFQEVSDFLDGEPFIIVVGKPSLFALTLLKKYEDFPSSYDAMDSFPYFYTGMARRALMKREREIAGLVDSITASSVPLKEHWRLFHHAVQLIPNGLDVSSIPSVKADPLKERVSL